MAKAKTFHIIFNNRDMGWHNRQATINFTNNIPNISDYDFKKISVFANNASSGESYTDVYLKLKITASNSASYALNHGKIIK